MTPAGVQPPGGHVWLAHPHPLPGELLSSWLLRGSRANRTSLRWFLQLTVGEVHADLDRGTSPDLIRRVASALTQPEEAVAALTMRTLEGRLVQRLTPSGPARWVVPSGGARWKTRLAGLPLCPRCLAEGTSYLRLEWRYAFMPCCPVHRVLLVQRCPACHAPTDCFRGVLRNSSPDQQLPLSTCWQCGGDYRDAVMEVASPLALRAQQHFEEALQTGEVALGEQRLSALTFSDLAYDLLRGLCRGTRTERFQQQVARAAQLDLPVMGPGNTTRSFELLPVLEQMRALALLGWLLEAWPARFRQTMRAADTSCRDFTPHLSTVVPPWCAAGL